MHMRRYGRFVIMRSSGPEICGLENGRKSRGGGMLGFQFGARITVDELYKDLLPEIERYTILFKGSNMNDLASQF